MKFLVAGGGTGGHVFSGLAVAEDLMQRNSDTVTHEVCFVGSDHGLEKKLVPQAGFPLQTIRVFGLKRVGFKQKILSLAMLIPAFFSVLKILLSKKPDIVLGVGGYASGPIVLTAALLGIPTAIIEQNSIPGITNRILGRWVRRVFLAFPTARKFFPAEKCFVSGNPIRLGLVENVLAAANKTRQHATSPFRVLIFGGSQGARSIDQAMMAAVPLLGDIAQQIFIHHQCSKNSLTDLTQIYKTHHIPSKVEPFIDDMAGAYGLADLVICRAGAVSVSEIATLGKPALLIPFPFAADNHQEANARCLVDDEAALMVLDRDLSGARLVEIIRNFLKKPEELDQMGQNALQFSSSRSAQMVVDSCHLMLGR